MANALKGQVGFTLGEGAEVRGYTLLLDFNALCELEADFPGIMDGQFEMNSPSAIRRVFHVGLSESHPDIDERGAGRLIQEIGLARVAVLVGDAFKASFPEAEGSDARPPKAPAKAGAGSGR